MRHITINNFFRFLVLFILVSFTLAPLYHAQAIPNTNPDTFKDPIIPKDQERKYNLNRLVEQKIPVYCGDSTEIFSASHNVMLERQILVGEVRNRGLTEGDLIGILSFGHSAQRNAGTLFMTIPGVGPNGESMTCIMGYGINWKFFDAEGNEILGDGNESNL